MTALKVAFLVIFLVTLRFRSLGSMHHRSDRLFNISKSISAITDGYDIRLRPNFASEPLRVGMDMVIVSFDSISEVNMDYTITLSLNQYWTDERLTFAVDDETFNLSGDFADKIWVPDTFFANDKNSFLHDVTEKNKMVRLYSNGSIVYGMRFTSTLACMMDLHYYPLDSQNCTVEIESYGYTVDDVVMYWTEVPVEGVDKVQLPQFTIWGYDTIDRRENLSTGVYQRLSLIFKMQRNIGYFVFQTYLPSILIVMLTWVSFWINHEATSARVALGITTVLTMTTISTGVRSSLPRISYVKAIDIYLVMCFVFVFAALLEYAAVNYTYWGARAKRKSKQKRYTESDESELVELNEVRLSPIPSLRNRQATRVYTPEGESMNFPPSFRMIGALPINVGHRFDRRRSRNQRSSSRSSSRSQSRSSQAQNQKRILQNLRNRANAIRITLPKIKDVNLIDKYSRVVFPVSFIIFNLAYWGFYIL